jgi:hypothetical protein
MSAPPPHARTRHRPARDVIMPHGIDRHQHLAAAVIIAIL